MAAQLRGRRSECEFLEAVLAEASAGRSRAVVLRGEPGAGKSALLDFVVDRASGWCIATAVGVESEMELAYSGLHQLCSPMLDHLDRLPLPQRSALATVFGRESGPAPDRFMVGLAVLTLLADFADEQPLLCVIDDGQWLDDASAQIVVFVARRLLAERIALVCAARTGQGDDILRGLPVLPVAGLGDTDARALLLENVPGPIDAAVCEQVLTESRGNPLALIELPRTWTITDLAGGFGLPTNQPVTSRIERSFATRLLQLPEETQLVVAAAAAEPLGDPLLLHRAAATLDLDLSAAGPAVDAGLLDTSGRIEFMHPLVRSAAYRSTTEEDRRRVHHALAEATDADRDPDRRAWHRARATAAPNEDVAAELERSAGRAQARGGVAAAAAFLERAAALSPDPAARARRSLAAAEAKQLAGAPQAASILLTVALDGPLDDRKGVFAVRLKGQIALDLRRVAEAVPLLLDAARRLEPMEPDAARETYLEAMRAGILAGRLGGDLLSVAAEAARKAPRPEGAPRAADLLIAALASRFTDGYAASTPLLRQAVRAFLDEDVRLVQDVRWPWFARRVALEVFDKDGCDALCRRSVQLARDRGALGVLPLALNYLATVRIAEGDLAAAEALVNESEAIADATGAAAYGFAVFALAGLRGNEQEVTPLVEAVQPVAIARGEGGLLTKAEYASALLHNGMGVYNAAFAAARNASARDGETYSDSALLELIEAATRCGKTDEAAAALDRLTERTHAAGTEWALGIEARSRALLAEEAAADELYLEAIDRLARDGIALEQARAHLLYGESLRRAGRRVEARAQLRTAHEMLTAFGVHAFAERARRELAATGEKVRRRQAETRDELTAQEMQIAELARDGHSNPEIAAQLFLSSRTVEWHLRKVFAKLGISSRRELEPTLR